MNNAPVERITRIASMLLDHIVMTTITLVFAIPWIIKFVTEMLAAAHEATPREPILPTFGYSLYFLLIGYALYICKDTINGRSIAKRAVKHQVVNAKTGIAANPLRCLVRNLFIVLWPLEVIAVLANPSRRIGDLVAGTMVVAYTPQTVQPKPNYKQAFIAFTIVYLILLSVAIPFKGFIDKLKADGAFAPNYVASSYNQRTSDIIKQKLEAELGEDGIDIGVSVYDSVIGAREPYINIVIRSTSYTLTYPARTFAFTYLGKDELEDYPRDNTEVKMTIMNINGNSISSNTSTYRH